MEEKNIPEIVLIEEDDSVESTYCGEETVTTAPTTGNTGKGGGNADVRIIDLGAITRLLWKRKWVFVIVWIITFIASASYIVCIPRTYTTMTKVAPETESGVEGGLSSLASSFGFNLGDASSADAIYPMLYPDLMDDNGFVSRLFDIRVTSDDGVINTTYYDYLANYQLQTPWASTVYSWKKKLGMIEEPTPLKKKADNDAFDPYVLTRKQDIVVKLIQSNISISYDKKSGVIAIVVQDQDRQICKTMADSTRARLQEYITRYRTSKAQTDVEYYQRLTDESKTAYEAARRQYAAFSDANTDITLPSLQSKMDDMENDLQLKYNTFTAMTTQLQAARAKLRERTPAFTLLQGAAMPLKPSGPKRMIFVAAMLLLSTIVLSVYYLRGIFFRG